MCHTSTQLISIHWCTDSVNSVPACNCSSLCICLRLLQASTSKNVLRHTRQEVIYSLPSSVCQWVMAMLCERVGKARRISPFGFFILFIASKNSRHLVSMVTMFIHRNLVFEWVVGNYDASLSHSLIPSPTAHIQLWCPSTLQWHLNLDISPSDCIFVAFFLFEHVVFLSFLLSPTAISSVHLCGHFSASI